MTGATMSDIDGTTREAAQFEWFVHSDDGTVYADAIEETSELTVDEIVESHNWLRAEVERLRAEKTCPCCGYGLDPCDKAHEQVEIITRLRREMEDASRKWERVERIFTRNGPVELQYVLDTIGERHRACLRAEKAEGDCATLRARVEVLEKADMFLRETLAVLASMFLTDNGHPHVPAAWDSPAQRRALEELQRIHAWVVCGPSTNAMERLLDKYARAALGGE